MATAVVTHEVKKEVEPPSRLGRLRSALAELWSVIFPFLVIRLCLELVGMVTVYYLLPLVNRHQPIYPNPRIVRFPDMLWLMWDHFDSGFYLSIAHGGYWGAASLKGMSNWAFFPLYPVLIRLLALPFGNDDDAFRLVGILVANVAALFAVISLYKLTKREWNKEIAARAALYLALFPMSFYLSAIYPESLFLALTVSSIYYTRLRRWWLAGVLGGLAALTRPQGVFLVLVVGWEYWQFLTDQYAPFQQRDGLIGTMLEWIHSRFFGFWHSFTFWSTWRGIGALLLIPVGLGIFCLYAKWQVNHFLAFELVEHNGWGRSFTNPVMLLLQMLQHPRDTSPYDWNFYGLNMAVIFFFLLLLVPIFCRLGAIYGIFALVFVVMPLTVGETNSIARFYLGVFPAFMLLGWWSSQGSQEQRESRHNIIVAAFAILLSLAMAMFTLGIYSMS